MLEILKVTNAVYHNSCISNNQQKLKRPLEKRNRDDDKKKEAKANRQSKSSYIKETPSIILGENLILYSM